MKRSLFLFGAGLLPILALLFCLPAHASIAHDADSNAGALGNVSTFNWTHTCTGSNGFLKVGITVRSNSGTGSSHPTAISYNSVALTEGPHISPGGATTPTYTYTGIWYLKGPATGANSIAVTLSSAPGATLDIQADATSFTGVDQTTPLDNSGVTNTGIGTGQSLNLTTSNANAWIVDFLGLFTIWNEAATAAAPQVASFSSSLSANMEGFASYQGPIVTPASTSESYTTAHSDQWQLVAISMKPASTGARCTIPLLGAGPC